MTDQMSTDALELYCRNRAKSLGELTEYDRLLLMDVSDRLCSLQSENAELQANVPRMEAEHAADLLARGPKANDPLTLEELRKMDGEPVWLTPFNGYKPGWRIVCGDRIPLRQALDGVMQARIEDVGRLFFAYRRKPEGGGE